MYASLSQADIADLTRFLAEAFSDINELIGLYQVLVNKTEAGEPTEATIDELQRLIEHMDLPFLLEEIPTSINQSADGIDRVSTIIKAMKEFSHPGSEDLRPEQINRAIENTTVVARAEWKYCSELELLLDPELPDVDCSIGDINQAVLNIVVNAAHAIEERRQRDKVDTLGQITITTAKLDDYVTIAIADTGGGISDENRRKIFDPFFTTKDVGKGTGQGLSIAYRSIVDKHRGKIDVTSEIGIGTTFTITLPISALNGAANESDHRPASNPVVSDLSPAASTAYL